MQTFDVTVAVQPRVGPIKFYRWEISASRAKVAMNRAMQKAEYQKLGTPRQVSATKIYRPKVAQDATVKERIKY